MHALEEVLKRGIKRYLYRHTFSDEDIALRRMRTSSLRTDFSVRARLAGRLLCVINDRGIPSFAKEDRHDQQR